MLEYMENGMDVSESKEVRWEELLDKWQEMWIRSLKGRTMYGYCESIRERMAAEPLYVPGIDQAWEF